MIALFKALGLTVTIVVCLVVVVIFMYISYLLAIGTVVSLLTYIGYKIFSMEKNQK